MNNKRNTIAGGLVVLVLIINILLGFLPDYLPAPIQSFLDSWLIPIFIVLLILLCAVWAVNGILHLYTTYIAQRFDASYYAKTFIAQYDRESQNPTNPIVEPIFRDDLKQKFIPLMYVADDGESGSLDAFIDQWLAAQRPQSLVILGDYGSGKTTFCLTLMYRCLVAYQQEPKKNILPLYFSFRDIFTLKANDTPEQQMINILTEQYGIQLGRCESVIDLVQTKHILLILDGFDEIANTLNAADIQRRFRLLEPLLRAAGGIIITCRSNYFLNTKERNEMFSLPAEMNSSLYPIRDKTNYKLLSLQKFDQDRQQTYLTKAVDDPQKRASIWNAIREVYDLSDLASRPILLRFIVASADGVIESVRAKTLDSSIRITAAVLYREYVNNWFKREEKERLIPSGEKIVPRKDQQEVLEQLALKLFNSNREQISREDLIEFLRDQVRDANLTGGLDIGQFEYTFNTCTFLTDHKDNRFGFVHRSFLEFFVAEAFLSDIRRKDFNHFGQQRLFGVVKAFLAELIEYKDAPAQGSISKSECIACLKQWLEQSRTCDSQLAYLGGNSAALLCQLGVPLSDIDMSGVRLKDADLTEGNLRNSNLRGANLDGSILTRADFSGSDLEDADLRNTFVKDTMFHKANLRGASFRNIRMIGGPNRIWKASFTPNYQHIITGTDRGNLLIQPFTVRPGSAVRDDSLKIIPVDSSGVLYFTFSPDGKQLAVSDRGRNVYLYHWERVLAGDTDPHRQYLGGDDYVRWLDFSPDGTCLASGGRDHAVKIWSLTGHSMPQTLSFHTGPVMYVLWSPDGRYLASTGYDANICLWSIQHDDVQRIVLADGNSKAHTGIIRSLAFNSQGTLLASGSEDHYIKIWNVPDQSSYPTLANQENVADDVFCIQFIEHDRTILFGCSSGTVRRMDAETFRVTHTAAAHTDMIRSFSLYEEAGYLLTASWDGTIKLWNLADLSFVDEVYRLNQIDVQYGRTDAFAGACIQDIRDVSDIFRQYLSKLGATSDCEV